MKKYEFWAKQYKRHIGRIVGVCYRYVALPAREGDSGSRHLGGRNRSNVDGYTLSKKNVVQRDTVVINETVIVKDTVYLMDN